MQLADSCTLSRKDQAMSIEESYADVESKDIAIVGMSGRFPGADDIHQFWQNLCAGKETISFFSDEELRAAGVPAHIIADPSYVKARPILKDIEWFDAQFFGYSPREAELMDPQQRVFLECAWEALEHAGYDTETYKGLIGVFAGTDISSYLLNNIYSQRDSIEAGATAIWISNDKDFLPSRVSFKLNLTGPSVALQTTCSTSLVAVHLASQSLLNYDCDMALAGAVSIKLPQQSGYIYEKDGLFSPDGHIRTFDARAKGTIFGNGVGIVVLKRLEDALANGDTIYAVIKGSAINHDGAAKVGYTAPSVDGQAEVIAAALAMADVDIESIGYVETHGTGTDLGDPIEITALTKVFRASTSKTQFCALGAVKPNIGHLDTAAGAAGLIKATLALFHQTLPPTLHFTTPNPAIDFAASPFHVLTQLTPWPRIDKPRRAGVSAFGISGTNAHLVLEEAPALSPAAPPQPTQLLLLSARTPTALATAAQRLAAYLQRPD